MRRRIVVIVLLVIAVLVLLVRQSPPPPAKVNAPSVSTSASRAAATPGPTPTTPSYPELPHTVFIHYYAWYSAPPRTSDYGHWDASGAMHSPGVIQSAFYPKLGPYDSGDPAVLRQHMAWLKAAKVDVIMLSWWGVGSPADTVAPALLGAAADAGLNVGFEIEPYDGRSPHSIATDVAYLYAQYGASPAFFRTVRPTEYGPSTKPRGVFFLYDAHGGGALTSAIDALRNTPNDGIFIARMDDGLLQTDSGVRKQLAYSHVDGFYNYGSLPAHVTLPKSKDYLLIPAAIPGWDHTRIYPFKDHAEQDRENGRYYDASWQTLIDQNVEAVSIISFNEWHEGTQIEPAVPHMAQGYTSSDYEGAYGLSGAAATTAYLARTAYWVDRYQGKA